MENVSHTSLPEMESAIDPQVSTILRCLAPEEIDMLRDAFIFMDKDSDGFVNLEEMLQKVEASVPAERFGPLREYLTPLFLVADKDGDGKLSLTEFLMSFADGPGVVPADVVNSCVAAVRVRLTDEEISALQENFRAMDLNGDGYLDTDELDCALHRHLEPKFPDLTDTQYKEIVTVIMSSADADRDGRLCLSEFIRSFQEDQGVLPASFVDLGFESESTTAGRSPATRELTETEAEVLREAFAVLDKNDDGYIDFVDLYNALWESLSGQVEDKTQIKDLCDLIMATADRRKSGRLSLSEFVLGFLRNMEVMQIPIAVAQEKMRIACDKLQNMYENGELERLVTVFEDLDSNGDGYIDRAEMVGVLISLFKDAFPEWDEQTLNSVMAAIVAGAESHDSGRISLEEFIRSFVDGPGVLPPEAVRVLDDRAAASRFRRRRTTASDDDLRRISDALRSLNETADEDGCVTEENLRSAIEGTFADQEDTHPGKSEAMVQYVLSRFVNVLEGGRLAWNENVQVEEEEEDGAVEAEVGTTSLADTVGPIHVPTAQAQEVEETTAEQDASETNRVECANDGGAAQLGAAASVADQPGGSAMERPQSSSAGRRRRVVHADSIEVDPVTKSSGDIKDYAYREPQFTAQDEEGEEAPDGVVSADNEPVEGSAAAAVCEDFDRTRAADPLATIPAVVEKAPSTLLARSLKKSSTNVTKQNGVLASFRYGFTASSDHEMGSIFEDELRMLFKKYDTAKLGCLDRDQFKKVYCRMEQYGLEPSQAEVDRQFTKYAKGSDKIFFDEFCVLMLQRVQL